MVNTLKHETTENALHAVFSFHKLAWIYGLLVLKIVALTDGSASFHLNGAQRHCFPATDTIHARLPTADFVPKIIHLSLSAASQSQMCIARCRTALQMFTGRRRHPREVKELFNNEGPEDLVPDLSHSQKNGRLHEQRPSFMQ